MTITDLKNEIFCIIEHNYMFMRRPEETTEKIIDLLSKNHIINMEAESEQQKSGSKS